MLTEIARLITEGNLVDALSGINTYLNRNPDDPEALFLFGVIMMETDNPAVGKLAFERLLGNGPWQVWNNYGRCLDDLYCYEAAAHAFFRAYSLNQDVLIEANIAMNAVHRCLPDLAEKYAKRVLKHKPDSVSARLNLGYAHLMKREYNPGWRFYAHGMGHVKWRDTRNYRGEPVWKGEKGAHVVIYGEQGIGDQIAMAAPIKEVRGDCKSVTLDVHKKLRGLFQRSFVCPTHGTMFETAIEWPDQQQIDYSCSLSQLQTYYRDEKHKFTGKPFLIPDIIRTNQWKNTLGEIDKPKIGIAWTGGIMGPDIERRSVALADFLPFLDKRVHWVSLEYKDRSEEIDRLHVEHGIKVHDYPWATQTPDYDDTAALVANLDMVISVPTSVVHLAGGLGVECQCILHDTPHFMFGLEGEKMPFYESVTILRRGAWEAVTTSIKERIHELLDHHSGRAGARKSA